MQRFDKSRSRQADYWAARLVPHASSSLPGHYSGRPPDRGRQAGRPLPAGRPVAGRVPTAEGPDPGARMT